MLQSLQKGSWKNWQKLVKEENSYHSQVSQISVVPGQERKIKFHVVLSFPNSGFFDFGFRVPIGCQFFSPRDSYFLLFVSFCVENLTWQPSGWGPQNMARQKYGFVV